MAFSLNRNDYDTLEAFISALDAQLSRDADLLAQAMSLSIDHQELYLQALDEYFLRMSYEHDQEASSLFKGGTTIPVTIPLTADMTFIYSDATEV
jgi:hypothetical protein